MRVSVLSVMLCLSPLFKALSQNEVNYDDFPITVEYYHYVDNLGSGINDYPRYSPYLKSDIFIEAYYSKLNPYYFKKNSKVSYPFDPTVYLYIADKKVYEYYYTNQAKSGYLYINECVTSKIAEMGHDFKGLRFIRKNHGNPKDQYIYGEPAKLQYIFNGRIVKTKDDVKKVLKLKKKEVEVLYVIYNEDINTYIVSFVKK